MIQFDTDWNKIISDLKVKNAKKLFIQLPEGLKQYSEYIAKQLKGFDLGFSGDPCFGACDIPASIGNYDIILHFGHSKIPNLKVPVPVYYVELRTNQDIVPVADLFLKSYSYRKLGLLASVQNLNSLNMLQEYLNSKNREALIGKGDSRITYPGQVLGCNFSAARSIADKVDAFLIVTTGDFHAIGVELATNKVTIVLDPITKEIRSISDKVERIKKQRFTAIGIAKNSKNFAFLISTKIGQFRENYAKYLEQKLLDQNKLILKIYMELVDPAQFLNYKVDVIVSFTCSRIAVDDYLRFKVPIITPIELEIAMGLKNIEDYRFDEIIYCDALKK